MQKQALILKQALKIKIEKVFGQNEGPAVLYVTHDLLNQLNFCYDFRVNQLLSQKQVQIIEFEQDDEATDQLKNVSNVIFFLHPLPTAMRTISSIVKRNQAKNINKNYTLWLVPKIDRLCVDVLDQFEIGNKISIKSFNFGLIALNKGLTTLHLSEYCHEVDAINCSVEALLKLSKLTGIFKRIVGKGEKAKIILQKYDQKIKTDCSIERDNEDACLIVLDRKIDMVTPLVTGHSYQSLLDHYFGINLNCITIEGKLINKPTQSQISYLLYNDKDPVYADIAHLSVQQAREYLQVASEQTRAALIRGKDENSDTDKLLQVIQTLGLKFQQIQNHRAIINFLMEKMSELHFNNLMHIQSGILDSYRTELEDMHYLSLFYPVEHILKMVCLYSQVYQNGNFYGRFQKELLELVVGNYGIGHVYSFYLLQRLGMLRNQKGKNRWQQIAQLFELIPIEPHSYTKVHVLYSSLSVRFIELVLKNQLTAQMSAMLGRDNFMRGMQRQKKIKQVYIFYVGGITYSEISCIKLLEKQLQIKMHVLTTNVTGGYQMIKRSVGNPNA